MTATPISCPQCGKPVPFHSDSMDMYYPHAGLPEDWLDRHPQQFTCNHCSGIHLLHLDPNIWYKYIYEPRVHWEIYVAPKPVQRFGKLIGDYPCQ
jgi:hypothetical protein